MKVRAKMGPNVVMAPNLYRKTHGDLFEQKSHKNLSGKFGKIRAKIFHTPKNVLAPTPML